MLAEHMYSFVLKMMQDLIKEASCIAVTCDEFTTIDNSFWLCLHAYIMQYWTRKLLLLTLQKIDLDGYTCDALLAFIIGILSHHRKMEPSEVAEKLICFGADGISSFQGYRTGVSK